MIWQFVFSSVEAGEGKLDCRVLTPGYILMDVVIHRLYAVAFSSMHTPSWQVVAMGGGMCSLCAGNADSRSGFSSDLPTWAYQVIPLWIFCLFKQVCVEGGGKHEEKKCIFFFALVELWESISALHLLKDSSSIFWMNKKIKNTLIFRSLGVLWKAWKI